jgi:hypothetical protein
MMKKPNSFKSKEIPVPPGDGTIVQAGTPDDVGRIFRVYKRSKQQKSARARRIGRNSKSSPLLGSGGAHKISTTRLETQAARFRNRNVNQ